MRGLTLTQPWATLVAIGQKHIETRSWATSYRGPIAIHAARGLGPVGGVSGLRKLIAGEPFARELRRWDAWVGTKMHADPGYSMPRGAIVAVAELTTVYEIVSGWGEWMRARDGALVPVPDGAERAFGDYSPGRYAWLLAAIRRLPTPIPYRGALGLWRIPPELEQRISEALR